MEGRKDLDPRERTGNGENPMTGLDRSRGCASPYLFATIPPSATALNTVDHVWQEIERR